MRHRTRDGSASRLKARTALTERRIAFVSRASGGEFDCGKWRFRDIGDAASAVIDLYRHAGTKLSLKRERVRAMIADGTGAAAWGYDEFAPDLDIETASDAQLDALIEAGAAARRILVEGERHESFDNGSGAKFG